jgi:hypothetical protein
MKRPMMIATVCALGLACAMTHAAEIVDTQENHAFDVPTGWDDQHAKFGLFVLAEGSGSLSESKLPFAAESLDQASEKTAAMFARANTTFKRIGTPVALTGKTWTGRVTAFAGTVNTILLMVAKDSRKYRVFHLTVRNEQYAKNQEQYWKILRTWRSPAR